MAIDKEKARSEILALTLTSLANRGLEGTNARSIAKDAGVSVGSLYNIFGDLDQLIMLANCQTYDDLAIAGETALNEAISKNGSVLDQLYALTAAYVEFIEDHNNRWMAVLAFNRKGRSLPKWYSAKQYIVFAIIERALGGLPTLTDEKRSLLTRALWASVHGIVTNVYSHRVGDERAKAEAWAEIEIIVSSVVSQFES